MRLLRQPGLWVFLTIALFALTIGQWPDQDMSSIASDQEVRAGDQIAALGTPAPVEPQVQPSDTHTLDTIHNHPDDDDDHDIEETVMTASVDMSTTDQLIADARETHLEDALTEDAVGGPTDEEGDIIIVAESAEETHQEQMIVTHVVEQGETLSQIAAMYGVDQNTIIAANDIFDINRLLVGEELKVLTIPGAVHSVRRGESLWDISRMYQTDMDAIIALNGLTNPERIQPQQQIVVPGEAAARIGTTLRSETLVSPQGQLLRAFSWPTTGRISSHYGPRWGSFHHGLDLAVPSGTPIRAAARGVVTFSGVNGGYGNLVIIDHGDGVETRYAHNSRNMARVGQRVARGEIVAYSGNTGNSTGPHLHFEIRLHGQSYDPINFLR